MIEGKFYANRFNKKVEILENAGIRMGLGEKYLLRRLSQQYAYHCLRKDFEEESEKLKLWETALSKGRTKKEMRNFTCVKRT